MRKALLCAAMMAALFPATAGADVFAGSEKGRDPNKAGLHVIDDTFFGPPD
jgi:hypothetical protein